jgi:hypothetical protein
VIRRWAVLGAIAALALRATNAAGVDVQYFPSIMYGHILIGTGASRYETSFVATARKATRVTIKLFDEKGEPMEASFLDETGDSAGAGSSFEFFLARGRTIRIRIQLPPEEMRHEVAVKTGWATFAASEDIDVMAVIRITRPDGSLLSRYLAEGEFPPAG